MEASAVATMCGEVKEQGSRGRTGARWSSLCGGIPGQAGRMSGDTERRLRTGQGGLITLRRSTSVSDQG